MIFYERPSLTLHQGHVLDVLRGMEAESCQAIVTSPPYWGLRDYKIEPQIWPNGGKASECEHEWGEMDKQHHPGQVPQTNMNGRGNAVAIAEAQTVSQGAFCHHCGSWRGSLGLEPTIDLFMKHLMEVMGECRRVLRRDGVMFCNLGDSYASGGRKTYRSGASGNKGHQVQDDMPRPPMADGLKPKDLCLIPFRFAVAAQEQGWYVRSDIIWVKPNPMPESCTDRPTSSYEHIFLLTKSERYFYDAEAVKEPCTGNAHPRGDGVNPKSRDWRAASGWDTTTGEGGHSTIRGNPAQKKHGANSRMNYDRDPNHSSVRKTRQNESYSAAVRGLVQTRNMRDVWEFPTEPLKLNHFAAFPRELARRCIKAGTPEAGCCSQCGRPWERVVEKKGGSIGHGWNNHEDELSMGQRCTDPSAKGRVGSCVDPDGQSYQVRTLGFRAACGCGAPSQPATVLDPFGGSGTVGIVANELGRRAVLIELNPDYCAMARERLLQEVLL